MLKVKIIAKSQNQSLLRLVCLNTGIFHSNSHAVLAIPLQTEWYSEQGGRHPHCGCGWQLSSQPLDPAHNARNEACIFCILFSL